MTKLTLTIQIEGKPLLKVRSAISDEVHTKMGEASVIAEAIHSMALQVERFLSNPPIPCATVYSGQSGQEKGEKC